MPEAGGSKIEVPHHLREGRIHASSPAHQVLEVAEAFVLAIVAVATAWSGYQAALWTGRQAELYGQAGKLRIQAEGAERYANQERLYDASTVVEWLKAQAQGNKVLADLFERRFLPEFRPAFEAWKQTDPLNNPSAPPGPELMQEYRSSRSEQASQLDKKATAVFDEGTRAREDSDLYVRATVTLATVLLLVAIGQRFKSSRARIGLAVFEGILLCFPIYHILTLPRG